MNLMKFGTSPESKAPAILAPDGRPARREQPLSIDADRVGPRLYQGAEPPLGPTLKQLGFDVVVFAAEENQPKAHEVPGLQVIYCPMTDGRHVPAEEAKKAALKVAELWRRGARVLVTCHMGWNRSGLITALAWRYITGRPGVEAVRAVKAARGDDALSNRYFREYVANLGPLGTHVEGTDAVMGSIRVEYAGKSEESLTGPALVLGALLFFGAFAARR